MPFVLINLYIRVLINTCFMSSSNIHNIPSAKDIVDSHTLIRPFIHETPVMTCHNLDAMAGCQLYFKCENFQKVGAFKMRGAANAALRLNKADLEKGLATHSSGNHAQAVARAARELGVPAYIVMPKNAPAVKVAGTRGYGAEIIFCENTPEARAEMLEEVVDQKKATFIHPFDNYNVIAGQATVSKELIDYLDFPLDILMAPVGGGGLLSGTGLSVKYFSPETEVIAGEPLKVDDAKRTFVSGQLQGNSSTDTIADGLRTPLSAKTFEIIQANVSDILTVKEEAIVHAMKQVWERMKIIIEPSSAVPLAAVFSYPERFKNKKVGIIFTGGNVDVGNLPFN